MKNDAGEVGSSGPRLTRATGEKTLGSSRPLAQIDPHPRLAGLFKNSKASIEEAAALEARLRQLCQKQTIALQLQPIEE